MPQLRRVFQNVPLILVEYHGSCYMVLALLSFPFSFQDVHKTPSLLTGSIIVLGYSFSSTLAFSGPTPWTGLRYSVVVFSVSAVKASSNYLGNSHKNVWCFLHANCFLICCSEILTTWETSHFCGLQLPEVIVSFVYLCTIWKLHTGRISGWVQGSASRLLHCSKITVASCLFLDSPKQQQQTIVPNTKNQALLEFIW